MLCRVLVVWGNRSEKGSGKLNIEEPKVAEYHPRDLPKERVEEFAREGNKMSLYVKQKGSRLGKEAHALPGGGEGVRGGDLCLA